MSADNWGICPKCKGGTSSIVNTLREDWDIGIDEYGLFEINYRASCRECGFDFKYEYFINVLQLKG